MKTGTLTPLRHLGFYLAVVFAFSVFCLAAKLVFAHFGIKSLHARTGRVELALDLSHLQSLTADRREDILNHLRRSAEWKVTVWPEPGRPAMRPELAGYKAIRRIGGAGNWHERENVVNAGGGNEPAVDCVIYLGISAFGDVYPPSSLGGANVVAAAAPAAAIDIFAPSAFDDRPRSKLIIEGNGLLIEIGEYSPSESRELTREALQKVAAVTKEPSDGTLPKGSVRTGESAECLLTSSGAFRPLIAAGYANPQAAGQLGLVVLGKISGERASYQPLPAEAGGWSENADEQYFFSFPIAGYDLRALEASRFELHYFPGVGKPSQKLADCRPS